MGLGFFGGEDFEGFEVTEVFAVGDTETEEVLRRRERVVVVHRWGFGRRREGAGYCMVGERGEHFFFSVVAGKVTN